MNEGERVLLKVFSINPRRGREEEEINNRIKLLCNHEVSLTCLEKMVNLLTEVQDNDKVNDYIERLTQKDKYLKDLNFKTINQLIGYIGSDMIEAKQKLKKLKQLKPLIMFLYEDCRDFLSEDIEYLIKIYNRLLERCIVKNILAIDKSDRNKGLKELSDIGQAFTLPSNVFYLFSLKKLFEDQEIYELGSLFDNIKDIMNITAKKMDIGKIKHLHVQDFNYEIIQKAKDLIEEQEYEYEINENLISSLIYKQIESNFLEFSTLDHNDKLFLQTTVARIIHMNSFKELGYFCHKYFITKFTQPNDFMCFHNIFKPDDKLLIMFQNFAKISKKTILKADIVELENMKWPSFDDMGIEVQQASQFFMFWHCIIQLISLKLEDENNEIVLLSFISNFLKNKNIYIEFQKKMQQAYIEPTIQYYYVIFESVMKMLNASDIANPSSNFKSVSKNAAAFLEENPTEFYKISNGIDALIENKEKIGELFSTGKANAVILEYDFVKRTIENELFWHISCKNHVQLINKKQANHVEADFVKLRLITARLNIDMIRTENITKSDECRNAENFVKFFQIAESLSEKLRILHNLGFDIGDKEITNESLDSTQIETFVDNYDKIIQIIDKKFSQIYTDDICLLTKEQFFSIYQLINKYSQNKEMSPDLLSIFEGTIISSFIIKEKTPVEDYYKLFGDNFQSFDLNDDFSDDIFGKFENSLTDFSKVLTDVIHQLMEKRNNCNEYSIKLDETGNLDNYITEGTVRCINLNTASIIKITKEKVDVSSKYQLHLMILYLLQIYKPQDNALPLPTQLLICSTGTTISQIDSFLGYFNSITNKGEKCMFIVVSPIQLQPTLYDYLMTKLKEINETIISAARIVVLFENEDLTKKPIFGDNIKCIKTYSFQPVFNTENLQNFYKMNGSYGIRAYYIYKRFPRTGKTHTILKHINEKYPDHIYTRVLVNESTTLTSLINHLNIIRKVDNKGKTIIIHFNVDDKCNANFHLYIQNMAFFRSLNDGISTPFLVNNEMVFYFEFGSRPSYGKSDFIQNIFPIADYIEKIKIPNKADEFFSFDDYHIIPHEEIENALKVIKLDNYKDYLIEAATIAKLDQDKESFLKISKSSLYVSYQDFIYTFNCLYDELKKNPKLAYHFLLGMFKENNNVSDFCKEPSVSQINEVSKIISKFKGPILSQTIHAIEGAVGYNIRCLLVNLIIEAAVTNCILPYIPTLENVYNVEYSDKNEDKFIKAKEFIKQGHILAVCNPAGDQESQSFTLICNGAKSFDDLLKKFDCYTVKKEKYDCMKDAIKSAIYIIDSEWGKSQDSPDMLFEIFGKIFDLYKTEEKIYNIAMMVNIWHSLKVNSQKILKDQWELYIEDFKKKVRDLGLRDHCIEINKKYNVQTDDEDILRRKRFWYDAQDQVIKQSPFDISVSFDKQNKENRVFVSNDIYTFISNCEIYIQNEESLMLKYALTPQNIMRFIHLVYRIYSHIPTILIGETGCGKTFTMKFFSEIIGSNVHIIRYIVDAGTQEEDLRAFIRTKINELSAERSKILKAKLRKIANDPTTEAPIVDSINFLPIDEGNEETLTSFEEIDKKVRSYIGGLKSRDLCCKYDVSSEYEREGLKNFVIFNLHQKYQQIEKELKISLLFFDEFNTAPCQWFFKEIILDRYFEGKTVPDYIHFICAANPSRNIEQFGLDALYPIYKDHCEGFNKNSVYKVKQMQESFVPYLFPTDASREFGSFSLSDNQKMKNYEDFLYDININSEFDLNIEKKVEFEFPHMPYQFLSKDKNKANANELKEGDKHHFSLTDMFSTSFDYSFFYKITNNLMKSVSYSRALSFVLSRINIFCCRLLFHEIYKDPSFSSIRNTERCIQIMKWAYKFGIYEKLDPNLDFKKSIERLRKAFIIGLSVSFWIPLSNLKQKDGSDSHRKMFIDCVCKYWKKLLDECPLVSEVKNEFNAPNYNEWMRIIEIECSEYANIFIDDDDECISKKDALSENIWVVFICIMNNIPLWIMGETGTSKSLAFNIVINKLKNQNSRSEKIIKCPPLVHETIMCSNATTTEDIMYQLGKIVDISNMYKEDNYVIRILAIEGIEQADMSSCKPLAYLHRIIDNGYTVRQDFSVPIQIIGFSSYRIDSTLLDRRILLLRCSFGEESDIFKSTNLNLQTEVAEGTKK